MSPAPLQARLQQLADCLDHVTYQAVITLLVDELATEAARLRTGIGLARFAGTASDEMQGKLQNIERSLGEIQSFAP